MKHIDFNKLQRIAIGDKFQMHWSQHKLTISGSEFPKGVNLTLSYTPKNPVINLHFTNQKSNFNKPQIRICEIEKSELSKLDFYFNLNLYSSLFQKFNVAELNSKEVGFLSIPDMFIGRNELKAKSLYRRAIERVSKIGRTRLKIRGEVEDMMNESLERSDFSNFFINQIVPFKDVDYSNHVDGGILITEDKTQFVLRIDQTWFVMKEDLKPEELLLTIMPPELYNQLKQRYDFAFSKIQELNTWEESKPYRSGTMRLFVNDDYEVLENDFTDAFYDLIDKLKQDDTSIE